MNKQLVFTGMAADDPDESNIWNQIPEEIRQEVEEYFAILLIKFISPKGEQNEKQ